MGEFVNEQVSTVNFLFCHDDAEQGVRIGGRLLGTFNFMAAQLLTAREAYPSKSYQTLGLLQALRDRHLPARADIPGAPEGIAIGNPERIVRALKRWESAGVDRVNFLLNALETIPQEQVLDSLRLFAREVMPHFAGAQARIAAAGGGGR